MQQELGISLKFFVRSLKCKRKSNLSGSSSFEVFSRFLELLKVKEVADTDDEEANVGDSLWSVRVSLLFLRTPHNEQQGVLQVPPKTKEQGKRINGRGRTISRAATRATRAKERMKNKGNENGK